MKSMKMGYQIGVSADYVQKNHLVWSLSPTFIAANGLPAFRRWDWGATAGIKVSLNQHYLLLLRYAIGIKELQPSYGMRNAMYLISLGYRL
jgi:hypothetical protein